MRKTKIVCTIGPASESVEILEQLIDAGMNVARLNFSHGDFAEHRARIQNIKKAAQNKDKTVAILLDTKGPEIRTGNFVNGEAFIERGSTVHITMDEVQGTAERFSTTYEGLINDVHIGSKILLDDGLIELEVVDIDYDKRELKTEALNNGIVKNKKGVNIPNVAVDLPGITEKDTQDILFGIDQDIDFIAASFVRKPSDVLEIKEVLEKNNASHIQLIPKIENQAGIDNITGILEVSDGLMVARGDLGVEIPPEEVPLMQKKLIGICNTNGKPVITATQMLDSMESNMRPTRAEASDVANAIFDGSDAVMLSGETAAGDYPVKTVQTMRNIAVKTETGLDHHLILKNMVKAVDMSITEAISQSVTETALNLGTDAIITPTESGHTSRMIAKYRPLAPIIAVTAYESVNRQLNLVWGVKAIMGSVAESTDEMLDTAIDCGLDAGVLNRGNRVIVTAGVPVGESGTTNLMKIHVIGDVIAKAQGVGRRSAYGKAVVAKNTDDALNNMADGYILVTHATDRDMMAAIQKAGGIIAEEGGLTSHAAVVGLSLGIPVIVGAENILESIKDGEEITIDGAKGDIYRGYASVL